MTSRDFFPLLRIALLFTAAVFFAAKARGEAGETFFVWRGGIPMGVFNAWFASLGLAGLGVFRALSWHKNRSPK